MSNAKKIAISGPGRSGTSFLVELFSLCGFTTPTRGGNYFDEVNAGLESRIDGNSPYEIDKDPSFHTYMEDLSEEALGKYDTLIVPVRNRKEAVISRATQERIYHLKHRENSTWFDDENGTVPAGARYRTDSLGISLTLAIGLWDLIECALRRDMKIVILHFPRFANDFDYLWGKIGYLLERKVSYERARELWSSKFDPAKIHFNDLYLSNEITKVDELAQVIRILQKENRELREKLKNG